MDLLPFLNVSAQLPADWRTPENHFRFMSLPAQIEKMDWLDAVHNGRNNLRGKLVGDGHRAAQTLFAKSGLVAVQMLLARALPLQLALGGDAEAFLGALVGLQFWHIPLPFLFRQKCHYRNLAACV